MGVSRGKKFVADLKIDSCPSVRGWLCEQWFCNKYVKMIDDLATGVAEQDMYTVSPVRPSPMLGKQGPESTL